MKSIIEDNLWSAFDVKDTRKVLNRCISASRSLAELKGMSRSMILPELTRNYICLNEARASAELAGIETDCKEVFKAAVAKEGSYPEELMKVLRISKSLKDYSRKPVTVENLMEVNGLIAASTGFVRAKDLDKRKMPESENSVPHPAGEFVDRLVNQYTGYVGNNSCTDELIKTTISMVLFETIAPFETDNSITGRVVMHMALNYYGLTDGCEILLSPVLLRHRDDYFRKLHFAEVSGNTEDWILFMLDMIDEAARDTMSTIFSIEQILLEINEECRDLSFYSEKLISAVFSNLYCKNSYLIESGVAERVTAMKYLKALEEIGILKSEKIGREVVFLNIPLCKIFLK